MAEHTYLRQLSVLTANAVRYGKVEEEQRLRRETRVAKVEAAIARHLHELTLTGHEYARLVAAIELHAEERPMQHAIAGLRDEVERLQRAVQQYLSNDDIDDAVTTVADAELAPA